MKLKARFPAHWPTVILTLVVAVIAVVNFVSGTTLTGWDNLHPEYNFPTDIGRSIFSVWEEYQSLGLIGGHAYSSDILRQLSLFALSFVAPITSLRYLSMFFMLLAGTLGAYVLSTFLLEETSPGRPYLKTAAFFGGLFYLLNLATVQTFYAPFESFTAHFAALPWLLWSGLNYVQHPSRKTMLFAFLALIFALPAAYIPTLFIVYLLALGLCLFVLWLSHRSKQILRRSLKLGLLIFFVNAFWLLPFAYFTVTKASVNLDSRINQMATETIFLQNKEFGNLPDVTLLKGFWFDNVDPDKAGIFNYMLAPWRDHLSLWPVELIGFLLFAGVLTGAVIAIRRRQPLLTALASLLLFSFIALAISTIPFSWVNTLVRSTIPILNQAFRFPYTKFSVLAALTYAMLFSVGIQSLFAYFEDRWSKVDALLSILNHLPLSSILHFLSSAIILILLITFTFPMFQGHLFYDKERLEVPQEYNQLFAFFRTQDPATRIADFPQPTFWGWSFYSWGYGGSGFLWYGIKQPILDRAFDVWSTQSENYYYEVSQAVYAKDPKLLTAVLKKYDITWLLVDKNIIYPPSPKALFYPELDALIKQLPNIQPAATFGKITVYKVANSNGTNRFVRLTGALPTANSYQFTDADNAFLNLGDYQEANTPDYRYPFRSLASVTTRPDPSYTATLTKQAVLLKTTLPAQAKPTKLRLPSYAATERITPVTLRSRVSGNSLVIEAVLQPMQLRLGQQNLTTSSVTRTLFTLPQGNKAIAFPLKLNLNGTTTLTVQAKTQTLGITFLSFVQTNRLVLSDANGKILQALSIEPRELKTLPVFAARDVSLPTSTKPQALQLTFPRITDAYLSVNATASDFTRVANCDAFRNGTIATQVTDEANTQNLELFSSNATACTSHYADTLPHDLGYLIAVTARNISGRPLHFWVENIDQRRGPIDTYLPADQLTSTYILPPSEEFGRSYAFHFDNIAIGPDRPENSLQQVNVVPVPYSYLSSLVVSTNAVTKQTEPLHRLSVSHPNESLYIIAPKTAGTLILSQAYDPGWQAYEIANGKSQMANGIKQVLPFIFGKRLTNHVQVDNWENGWAVPGHTPLAMSHTQVVIVYLPQYLEYLGFFLLLTGGVWVALHRHETRA